MEIDWSALLTNIDWGSLAEWASGIGALLACVLSIHAARLATRTDKSREASHVLAWRSMDGTEGVFTVRNMTGRLVQIPTVVVRKIGGEKEQWKQLAQTLEPDQSATFRYDLQRFDIPVFTFMDTDGYIWARGMADGDLVRLGKINQAAKTVVRDLAQGLKMHRKLGKMKKAFDHVSFENRSAFLSNEALNP